MFKFTVRYLKALAALLLAMVVYRLTVVPSIEPSARPQRATPDFTHQLGGERWWEDFFPPGSWQTQHPKVIHTDKGILLSNSWTSLSAKKWELKPLTIILPQSKSARLAVQDRNAGAMAEHDMWIVSAEEGAVIHFAEPFEAFGASNGKVPTVVRGELSGAIEVTRKVAKEAGKRPWRLRTYDLTIDRRQFSTQREVLIEWGDSIIQGRSLKVLLRGNLLGNQSSASSAWGPLDELELYHVDKIDVALPPGGLWADIDTPKLEQQPHLRELPARVRATCGGRFAFDFKNSTATLQNGVQIQHQLGSLPPDEFSCEVVSFAVEPPDRSTAGEEASSLAGIRVQHLEAEGIDSLRNFVGEKWVELRAPTIGAVGRAKRLVLDMKRQRVEFMGRLNRPGATQSSVMLDYLGNVFRAPKIEYQAAPPAPADKTRHLGWMFAEGPGELQASRENEFGETQVRWQESLKMTPSPQSEKVQWIELIGNAFVENKQHGFLASDRLEVWLKQNEKGDLVSAAPLVTGEYGDMRYLPERLYATGKTVLATPNIQAQVAELDLELLYAHLETAPASEAESGLALSDSAGNPMYQWVTPPASEAATSPSPADIEPSAAPEPVSVSGQSLQAKVVSDGTDAWIDNLQITGPVRVWRERTGAEQEMPWHVEGSLLTLATNRAKQVDMQIEGQPAKILVAEGSLESEIIRVDQAHNLVWMDRPGEFTIPVSALNRPGSADKPAIRWTNPPHCRWEGRMQFDGTTARIEGNIELDAALQSSPDQFWWLKGWAEQLDIILAGPMELTTSADPNVEVERLVLQRNVHIFASELDRNSNKRSREEIHVPSLTLHVAQSQMVGSGPGWIKSRFPAKDGLGRMASSGNSRGANQLQGAHLRFRDSMVGYLDRDEVIFDGKVELAVGPIRSWDDSVDVAHMQTLTTDQMLLNCDQLKIYDTGGLSSLTTFSGASSKDAWEFQATGKVAFNGMAESGEYLGSGYQITYTQALDRLLLRWDGRQPARLQRVPHVASEESFEAYVQSVAINPKTLAISNLKMGQGGFQIDMGQPGATPQGGSQLLPTPRASGPSPRQDFYQRQRP